MNISARKWPLPPIHDRFSCYHRFLASRDRVHRRIRAGPMEIFSLVEFDVRNSINSLKEFLMAMPSTPAIAFLAVALTAAAGKSIGTGNKKDASPGTKGEWDAFVDHWVLTLNPTPFNRFVVARWPSIVFDSCSPHIEKLSNQQLVGVRRTNSQRPGGSDQKEMVYQRKCIWTVDGGSLALDWPADLDLDGDHGLDTTLLLIPGSAKGSQEEMVKSFVQVALQSGYFSVVLNPRGCGNSPLTTPRIFSAGDSDDVRIALSHVARSRPWTTLMSIGWGYGANMLAKYLGEEESLTPLTAAVCINNPFDLEQATWYMKQNGVAGFDHGFVEILQSNKCLFQGQDSFDIARGLAATSVREFDSAISCPANGFKTLESFYRSASSQNYVEKVKTPVLFIQENTAAPLFSIPKSAFKDNPFATLLHASQKLSCSSSSTIALEWLAAVEIALLKGRHPLLQSIDLAIKPSKEWSTNYTTGLLQEGDEYITFESRQDVWSPQEETEQSDNNEEAEHGQAQQAAQTIFSALDMAMPGTLSPETKEQVLDAVGRGETVLTALQNAVPEEVREKMAAAVSAAVQARGMSLKLVGFKDVIPASVPSNESSQANNSSSNSGSSENKPDATTPLDATPAQGEKQAQGEKRDEPSQNGATTAASEKTDSNNDTRDNSEDETLVQQQRKPDAVQAVNSSDEEKSDNNDNRNNSDDETPVQQQRKPDGVQAVNSSDEEKSNNNDNRNNAEDETPVQQQRKLDAVQALGSSDTKAEGDNSSKNAETHPPSHTSSSINVQQAFQALSGLDDSTQMAVNNVFGVLEGMLDQLEKEKGDKPTQEHARDNETYNSKDVKEERPLPASVSLPVEICSTSDDTKLEVARSAIVAKDTATTEQTDELKDVHRKLKKTKISGFILRDGKAPLTNIGLTCEDVPMEQLANAEKVVLEGMTREVQRRMGPTSSGVNDELQEDLFKVANAAIHHVDISSRRVLSAEGLVDAVASAFRNTTILQQIVPLGVLVGVILASLVNTYAVVTTKERESSQQLETEDVTDGKTLPNTTAESPVAESEKIEQGLCGNVVGAVTAAAVGATAAFASSGSSIVEHEEEQEGDDDCYRENIVSSIAEKAFSIAAPIVPTKDGQIDHERLVAMLTDIGQKAGFLSFIGKAALLWGGLRGAMNVTERLLVFFRIAERSLHQRLVGFIGMALLLWSPIVLPLLPTLLNEWAAHSSGGVAKCASVISLYGAIIILVIIWGKKIRGFDQPLYQYGIRQKKLNLFAAGLAAGCGAVCLFYVLLFQLHYLKVVPSFLVVTSLPQAALSIGKLAKLTLEALAIGMSIAPVEELIFRSWLLEEIAVDLGEPKAIFLSSLLFALVHSLSHRSLPAIPGLWFLGVALAGARSKTNGNLALPIGLHAGLITANFVLSCGGFVVYLAAAPCWITGVHASSPLAGVVGVAMAAAFAALMFPWTSIRGLERITSL